ncbi:glycosyl hydrolase family 18 protein [Actinomadura flavalba]|uniref:glycosyl hydrolase family 18 protein n=1 Tax=Actinomadura flavalba TaxID=1120938 RepID=UPI0003640EDD|nr:glycosyl hydrolase family 18 protein [Actinomadura flavalba]
MSDKGVRRWVAVAGALALTAGAAVAVAPAASAATVTAVCAKSTDWGSGFGGNCTITNGTTATVNGWTLVLDLPAGTTITSVWDATRTAAGNRHTFTNLAWNGSLAPGAKASFGFNGSGPGWATACTVNGAACDGSGNPDPDPDPDPDPEEPPPGPAGAKIVGYFAQWGVYGRNYHVKNIDTSGSAAKLTHINYAFGNVQNGRCTIGDSYADYDRAYSAAESVDGVGDTWDTGALRGSFNQLRKLKKKYPHLKVLWSFGGWTWSGGFGQAAANPAAFAESCHQLVNDPRWAGVFDGIDIDWEYPNACGLTCDTSGSASFRNLMAALRAKFGSSKLVTAAITADASAGGKIDAADYGGAAQYVDWYLPMTYDFFGAWAANGPTAPHSPLTSYPGIPQQGFNSDAAITKLKAKGVPASKLLLGVGFYGRGWKGVTQAAPGGSAGGAAPGTYEAGIEDYKVLKQRCPATGTVAGTAYAKCGDQWWSYDTPATLGGKTTYAKQQGLGGAFFWELSGDTGNGELIGALRGGLG